MVVTPQMRSQIGPALSAGKSFLLYGRTGNGKTCLAEALAEVDESAVFVPHAVECEGRIIKILDPVHHRRVAWSEESDPILASEAAYDQRWVPCRRPFIVTGGELTMSMLDLAYNAVSKVYDAPARLKANNGIYLIDDFGRQKASPAEVLNRWIVPMDRRVDYLTFHTGGKVEVPFETLLVFSTNLNPVDLGDEAFLRRIDYKIFMSDPACAEFLEIFRRFCAAQDVDCPAELVAEFVKQHYVQTGKPFRRCHPRDVVTHALDLIEFERLPPRLTTELLERAFQSCFSEEKQAMAVTTAGTGGGG
ncbi:MAG: hypothetical protein FJW34_24555 [Acidobacteria bacterium]|nr:hypothetical protein [Acidobacteriota bacterium]